MFGPPTFEPGCYFAVRNHVAALCSRESLLNRCNLLLVDCEVLGQDGGCERGDALFSALCQALQTPKVLFWQMNDQACSFVHGCTIVLSPQIWRAAASMASTVTP